MFLIDSYGTIWKKEHLGYDQVAVRFAFDFMPGILLCLLLFFTSNVLGARSRVIGEAASSVSVIPSSFQFTLTEKLCISII